jgi:hypothetical protein
VLAPDRFGAMLNAMADEVETSVIPSEPSDQEDGLRECGVRVPENHRWWFSSAVAR